MLKATNMLLRQSSESEDEDEEKKTGAKNPNKVVKMASNSWSQIMKDSRAQKQQAKADAGKTKGEVNATATTTTPTPAAESSGGGFFLDFGDGEATAPPVTAAERPAKPKSGRPRKS